MSLRRLPPVGQPVVWKRTGTRPLPALEATQLIGLHSGTAALALALQLALAAARQQGRERREVILPGYGCPDLVAACVHAGAIPRLVDCEPDGPGLDLAAVEAACGPDTAAIVAVDFLGIQEPLGRLAELAHQRGALLIEDCAQAFPESSSPAGVAARVLSFGRGKPVNLLGGGALLLPEASPLATLPLPALPAMASLSPLKAQLFNLLRYPLAYGIISRLPGLELGATRYLPLTDLQALDERRQQLLPANVQAWVGSSPWRQQWLNRQLTDLEGIRSLPLALADRCGRLLRYPLLCDSSRQRERLLQALLPLGASPFYNQALADIDGIAPLLPAPPPPLPRAGHFARRLLTLPVHDRVTGAHLEQMVERLRRHR